MSDTGSTPSEPSPPEPPAPGEPGPPPPAYPDPYAAPPAYGQQPPSYGEQPTAYGVHHGDPHHHGDPYHHGQPQGYPGYGQPTGPPPNYLVWAILTTLFCFLPLGVASIVFAAQVNGKYAAGDYPGAARASHRAKQFAIWSAVVGVVGVVIVVFLLILSVGMSTSP